MLSWFSGFAGLDIGVHRTVRNVRTVAYCEREGYACANLVAKIEGELLDAAPVWTDVKTFPIESFRGLVDIFAAGYPCQGFSAAGKREGQKDPRFLWPWVLRAVAVIQPRLCFFENVEGHITLGLRTVIGDLEAIGYRCAWGIFSAAEVGASHRRKRVFIMAIPRGIRHGWLKASIREQSDEGAGWTSERGADVADSGRRFGKTRRPGGTLPSEPESWDGHRDGGGKLADTIGARLEIGRGERGDNATEQPATERICLPEFPPGPADLDAWRAVLEIDPTLEPALCELASRRPSRLDELRLAGNGVVWQTAAKAFRTLYAKLK